MMNSSLIIITNIKFIFNYSLLGDDIQIGEKQNYILNE
jgi:hypothetical protein